MADNFKNMNTTVLKTILVLKLFSREEVELSLSSIAERIKIPLSTAHRIVSTLVYAGFMTQNPENGKYRLGMDCYHLGRNVDFPFLLIERGKQYASELSKKYDEVVNLLTYNEHGYLIQIKQIKPSRSLTFRFDNPRELQVSASGKCFLAYMSEDEFNRIAGRLSYKQYTKNSITSKEKLIEILASVREHGYATEFEEGEYGAYCCAAPIMVKENCVAALSISIPVARLPKSEKKLIEDVTKTAKKISKALAE